MSSKEKFVTLGPANGRYEHKSVPAEDADIPTYLNDEFLSLGGIVNSILEGGAFPPTSEMPKRVREGMIIYFSQPINEVITSAGIWLYRDAKWWKIVDDPSSVEGEISVYILGVGSTPPDPIPPGLDYPPTGWSTAPPSKLKEEYVWASFQTNITDGTRSWSQPVIWSAGVFDGEDGPEGPAGKTFSIVADSQTFSYDGNGVLIDPISGNINFSVNRELVVGDVSWSTDPATAIPPLDGDTFVLNVSDFTGLSSMAVSATVDGVTDTVTIVRLQNGADAPGAGALSAGLSNEVHTVPTDKSGNFAVYDGSGTEIRLFEGTGELEFDGVATTGYDISTFPNGTWKIDDDATIRSNITLGTITDSGTYATVGEASLMTEDSATIVFKLVGKATNGAIISVNKAQSFSKNKQGLDGIEAQAFSISPDAQAFKYDENGDPEGVSTITFTAKESNIGGTPSWATIPDLGITPNTGLTFSITEPEFANSNTSDGSVLVTSSLGSFTDSYTIFKLSDGSPGGKGADGVDSLQSTLSNESHTVPTDKDGNSQIYTGSGTEIRVFEGSSLLTYSTTGIANSTYKVTPVEEPAGKITIGNITGLGSNALVDDHSDMTEDTVTVTYIIDGTTSEGLPFTLNNVQSLSKNKQGVDGADSKSFSIFSDALTFKYDIANNVSPEEIVFGINESNTVGDVAWSTDPDLGITPNNQTSFTITKDDFAGETSVKVLAVKDGLTDSTTIIKVDDGATGATGTDSLQIILSNEVHSIPTNKDGGEQIYTGSGTTVKVFQGPQQLSYNAIGTTPGTYNVVTDPAGITPGNKNPSTTPIVHAVYDDATGMGTDSAIIEFQVNGVSLDGEAFTLEKIQSFTKSKQGEQGVDAKTFKLISESQGFSYKGDGSLIGPQEILFTVSRSGLDNNTVTWSSDPYLSVFTNTGDTRTLDAADFVDSQGKTLDSVKVTASVEGGSLIDNVTVFKLQDGVDGTGSSPLQPILSNEVHVIPSDEDGVIASYAGSGTEIRVFEGTSLLEYKASRNIGEVGTWSLTDITSFNITAGDVGDDGISDPDLDYAVVGVVSDMDPGNVGEDSATVTYELSGTSLDGVDFTFNQVQSFSRNRQGVTGAKSKSFSIASTSPSFNFTGTEAEDPEFITFTTKESNLEGGIVWSTIPDLSITPNTDPTFTMGVDDFGNNDLVTVYATKDGLTDSIGIIRLTNGADGDSTVTVVLTNEVHTIPTDYQGDSPNYNNSGTTISVYEGFTPLQFLTTPGPVVSVGSWKIQNEGTLEDPIYGLGENIVPGGVQDLGTDAVTGLVTGLSEDTAKIDYTITGRDSNGVSFSRVKTQTFTRNKGGKTAESFTISSDYQSFQYDGEGELVSPISGDITFTGNKSNLAGQDIAWSTSPDVGTGAGSTFILPETAFTDNPSYTSITVIGTVVGLNGTYTDRSTVVLLSSGADGDTPFQIILDNDPHTVSSDENGNVPSAAMVGSSCLISLFEGTTKLVYDGDGTTNEGTWNVTSTPSTGITVAQPSSSSDDALSPDITAFANTVDVGSIDFHITGLALDGETVIDLHKTQSFSKNKQGIKGINAKTLTLSSTSLYFKYDKNDEPVGVDPVSIVITANPQNLEGTGDVVWSGSSIGTASGNTYTILESDFSNPSGNNRGLISITASKDGLSDTVTIGSLEDGFNGLSPFLSILSNEAHTIPGTSTGTVPTGGFDGSSTLISVYEGVTQLSHLSESAYDALSVANRSGFWKVDNDVGVGTNVTVGSVATDTIDNKRAKSSDISGMSTQNGYIDFNITGTGSLGDTFNLVNVQSFTKTNTGLPGEDAKGIILSSDSQVFLYDTDGDFDSPATITFSAQKLNLTEDIVWSSNVEGIPVTEVVGDNTKATIKGEDFDAVTEDTVEITAVINGTDPVQVYSDVISIQKLSDGTRAPNVVQASLTNESHTIYVASGGTANYLASGTEIRVYDGLAELDFSPGFSNNDTGVWAFVNDTATANNIDFGGYVVDPGVGVLHAIINDHSNMTADSATIVYDIVGITDNGDDFTLTKVQTFVKSFDADSITGDRGAGVFSIENTGTWVPEESFNNAMAALAASATTGGIPVIDDSVTIYGSEEDQAYTVRFIGGGAAGNANSWETYELEVHGSLFVKGTVKADSMNVGDSQQFVKINILDDLLSASATLPGETFPVPVFQIKDDGSGFIKGQMLQDKSVLPPALSNTETEDWIKNLIGATTASGGEKSINKNYGIASTTTTVTATLPPLTHAAGETITFNARVYLSGSENISGQDMPHPNEATISIQWYLGNTAVGPLITEDVVAFLDNREPLGDGSYLYSYGLSWDETIPEFTQSPATGGELEYSIRITSPNFYYNIGMTVIASVEEALVNEGVDLSDYATRVDDNAWGSNQTFGSYSITATGVYDTSGNRVYSPINKNIGTTSGTYAEGDHTHTFSEITNTPTTLSGYGITDAQPSVSATWVGIYDTAPDCYALIDDNNTELEGITYGANFTFFGDKARAKSLLKVGGIEASFGISAKDFYEYDIDEEKNLPLSTIYAKAGHTHDYVSKSGDTMTGSLKFTEGSPYVYDASNLGRILSPDGAAYTNGASSVTGAFKIKLPIATVNKSGMISMEVTIFDYSTDESTKLFISAYHYGTNQWTNQTINVLSPRTDREYNIRFGADDTSDCFWIGELTSVWAYPKVTVQNVVVGHSTDPDLYASGWEITEVTSFDTVDDTIAAKYPVSSKAFKWTTPRVLTTTLTGDVTGEASMSVDGSAPKSISIATTVSDNSHNHNSLWGTDNDVLYNQKRVQFAQFSGDGGTGLASSTFTNPTDDWYSHLVLNHNNAAGYYIDMATGFNQTSLYLRRLASGTLSDWERVFADNYHPNADAWTNGRKLTLGGDLTGDVTFDGSEDFTLTATVSNDSHTHDGRYFTETESDSRFARIGTTSPSSNYLYATRSAANPVMYVRQASTGSIAKFFQNSTAAATSGDSEFEILNNAGILINSKLSTGITINADTDNAGSEDHLPFLKMTQDGGIGNLTVGIGNNKPYIQALRTDQTDVGNETNNLWFRDRNDVYSRFFTDAYHPNADAWTTPRKLTLGGDLVGNVTFDGSEAFTLSAQVNNDSHTHDGRYFTETESDARFLGISDKAADSDRLDGLDSSRYTQIKLRKQYTKSSTAGWVNIATTNGGDHGLCHITIAGYGSGKHTIARFTVTNQHGQSTIVQTAGDTYSGVDFSQVRTLYNTADRVYGGHRFQVYVAANSTIYYSLESNTQANLYNEWSLMDGSTSSAGWTQDKILSNTYDYALQSSGYIKAPRFDGNVFNTDDLTLTANDDVFIKSGNGSKTLTFNNTGNLYIPARGYSVSYHGSSSEIMTFDDFNPSLNPPAGLEGAISTPWLSAGAVTADIIGARQVNADKIVMNSGIDVDINGDFVHDGTTSIIIDPKLDTPFSINRIRDTVGGTLYDEPKVVFSVTQVADDPDNEAFSEIPGALVQGQAGFKFVRTNDAISDGVKRNINKRYNGPGVVETSGGGLKASTTTNVDNIQPVGDETSYAITISQNMSINDSIYFGQSSPTNFVTPIWQIKVIRGTITNNSTGAYSGVQLLDKTYTGTSFNGLETEPGLPNKYYGHAKLDITINVTDIDRPTDDQTYTIWYNRLSQAGTDTSDSLTTGEMTLSIPSFLDDQYKTQGDIDVWRNEETGYMVTTGKLNVAEDSINSADFPFTYTDIQSATISPIRAVNGTSDSHNHYVYSLTTSRITISNGDEAGTSLDFYWQVTGTRSTRI